MLPHADLPPSVRHLIDPIYRLSYPIEQGATSTVAFATTDRGVFVIKRAQGAQWCAWLAQEWRVLQALARSDLPIPRALHWEQNGADQAWLVMSHLPGVTLRQALDQTTDQIERDRLLRNWGAALRTIHRTAVPHELADPTPWIERALAQAEYNLIHYAVDGSDQLLVALRSDRPTPIAPTLIHGDFTADNTLVTDQIVTGVIDWAGGTWGDSRYDLALALDDLQDATDQISFWRGYGGGVLRLDEQRFFIGLYEFF